MSSSNVSDMLVVSSRYKRYRESDSSDPSMAIDSSSTSNPITGPYASPERLKVRLNQPILLCRLPGLLPTPKKQSGLKECQNLTRYQSPLIRLQFYTRLPVHKPPRLQ